jgi:hypothetical protein
MTSVTNAYRRLADEQVEASLGGLSQDREDREGHPCLPDRVPGQSDSLHMKI